MMRLVGEGRHLEVAPEQVVEVMRSINENMMSAEGHPSQRAIATIVGVRTAEGVQLYVHYWLLEDRVGLLYAAEAGPVAPSAYAPLRDEIAFSVESMGFLLDRIRLPKDPGERVRVLAQLEAFGGGAEGESGASAETAEAETIVAEPEEETEAETILILDEESESEAPGAPATAPGPTPGTSFQLDETSWRVFFRFLAAM